MNRLEEIEARRQEYEVWSEITAVFQDAVDRFIAANRNGEIDHQALADMKAAHALRNRPEFATKR